MKNTIKLGVTTLAVAAGLAIGVSTTQPVNAATWHKGTPKVLRGKWVDGTKEQILNYYPFFSMKANGLTESGIDPVINKNMHYHHKKGSHLYYVKGHETLYSHGKQVNYYKFNLQKTTRKHKSYKVKYYIYYQTDSGQTWRAKKANYGHYFYK